MALPKERFPHKGEVTYAVNVGPNLEMPLSSQEDPSLSFDQGPIVQHRRPPGVTNLQQWGEMKLPEGKWKGHSFAEVYLRDGMGPELSPICPPTSSSRSRSQGKDDEDRAREGTPTTTPGGNSDLRSTTALPSRMGTALHTKVFGPRSEEPEQSRTSEEKCHRGGRADGHAARSGKGDQGGQDGAPCNLAARGGQDSAGDWEQVKGKQSINHRQNSALSISHDLCHRHQIECAQLSIEKELETLRTVWSVPTGSRKASPWKLDLLEIYCDENSQLTEQAQRLGLKAKRFTFQDGDLSTSAGRTALWKVILEEKPKEIWVAPDCKYWGDFSRRNMGRSISTASKILEGRQQQRTHLRLCNDIIRWK